MLDSTIKTQLRAYLERLKHPIELVARYDERPASAEMRALLADIAECSTLVSVREGDTGAAPSAIP